MTFKPLIQLNLHDPENGLYGDCFRTSIAMVLGLRHEEVPHFCDGPDDTNDWRARFDAWLGARGYSYIEIPYCWDEGIVDRILAQFALTGGDIAVMVDGLSPRGTLHSTVAYRGVLYDPHPAGGGIVGADNDMVWVRVIAPKAGAYPASRAR